MGVLQRVMPPLLKVKQKIKIKASLPLPYTNVLMVLVNWMVECSLPARTEFSLMRTTLLRDDTAE